MTARVYVNLPEGKLQHFHSTFHFPAECGWSMLIHLSPQSFNWVFFVPPQATSPISINQYQHISTTSVKVWLRQGSRGEAAPGGIHPLQPGRSACDRPLRADGQEQLQLELSEEDYNGAKGGQHGSTQDVSREPSDFSQRLAQVEWIWMRTCHNWSLFGRWWIGRWCSSFAVEKYELGVALGGYLRLPQFIATRDNWMRSFGHPCQCICCFVQKWCVNCKRYMFLLKDNAGKMINQVLSGHPIFRAPKKSSVTPIARLRRSSRCSFAPWSWLAATPQNECLFSVGPLEHERSTSFGAC